MKQILKRFTVAFASSMAALGLIVPAASASSIGPWSDHHNWTHDYGIEIKADVNVLSYNELAPLTPVAVTETWHPTYNWHHMDNNVIDVDVDADVLEGNLLEADVDASVGSNYHWHQNWSHHHNHGGLLDLDLDLDLL